MEPGQSKLISNKALWINSKGERFANEAGQTHDIYYDVAHFDDQKFFAVYDQAMVDALDEDLRSKLDFGLEQGMFAKADTVAEAAAALGIDGAAAQTALDAYNELAASGEDTQFKKKAREPRPARGGSLLRADDGRVHARQLRRLSREHRVPGARHRRSAHPAPVRGRRSVLRHVHLRRLPGGRVRSELVLHLRSLLGRQRGQGGARVRFPLARFSLDKRRPADRRAFAVLLDGTACAVALTASRCTPRGCPRCRGPRGSPKSTSQASSRSQISSTMSSESMPSESNVELSSTVLGSMSRFSSRMVLMVSMVAMPLLSSSFGGTHCIGQRAKS